MTQTFSQAVLYAHPQGVPLSGSITVPGDKSMSHRAIMLGALACGTTTIINMLNGEDNLATLSAFRCMGVTITRETATKIVIQGVGKYGLSTPSAPFDMGNSGTAMRLLSGILVAQKFSSSLIGDASLSRRPMHRIIEPLTKMGALISGSNNPSTTASGENTPPLFIEPSCLRAIDYELPIASAQVKSAILLAGLYVQAPVVVREHTLSRDHTEKMLQTFGVDVTVSHTDGVYVTAMQPPTELRAATIQIPADISSAAFFIVAALIQHNSAITIRRVGVNPTRIGVLTILAIMGADIQLENYTHYGAEPVADIHVRSAPLCAIDIPAVHIPCAIDEFPIVFVAAALAKGTTRLRNACELRNKESDRLATMAAGLTALGVKCELHPDGIDITGQASLSGGVVQSSGDHRVAMSFAVAALCATDTVKIVDTANIATSFPDFVALANSLGFRLTTTV